MLADGSGGVSGASPHHTPNTNSCYDLYVQEELLALRERALSLALNGASAASKAAPAAGPSAPLFNAGVSSGALVPAFPPISGLTLCRMLILLHELVPVAPAFVEPVSALDAHGLSARATSGAATHGISVRVLGETFETPVVAAGAPPPLPLLRILHFFAPATPATGALDEASGLLRWLQADTVQVALQLSGWATLSQVSFRLSAQFRSSFVLLVDHEAVLGDRQLRMTLGLHRVREGFDARACHSRTASGVAIGGLRSHLGVLVPETQTDFFTADPLPFEWLKAITSKERKGQ